MAQKAAGSRPRPPRAEKAAAPEPPPSPAAADPNFEMRPDGSISWKLGDSTYILNPPGALAWKALHTGYSLDGTPVSFQLSEANGLPASTPEEQAAKLEALRAANQANDEWILGWYDQLFKECETNGHPFPRDRAPAWIWRGAMGMILVQLQGPRPPGVL